MYNKFILNLTLAAIVFASLFLFNFTEIHAQAVTKKAVDASGNTVNTVIQGGTVKWVVSPTNGSGTLMYMNLNDSGMSNNQTFTFGAYKNATYNVVAGANPTVPYNIIGTTIQLPAWENIAGGTASTTTPAAQNGKWQYDISAVTSPATGVPGYLQGHNSNFNINANGDGYTPVFVTTASGEKRLIELYHHQYVSDPWGPYPDAAGGAQTSGEGIPGNKYPNINCVSITTNSLCSAYTSGPLTFSSHQPGVGLGTGFTAQQITAFGSAFQHKDIATSLHPKYYNDITNKKIYFVSGRQINVQTFVKPNPGTNRATLFADPQRQAEIGISCWDYANDINCGPTSFMKYGDLDFSMWFNTDVTGELMGDGLTMNGTKAYFHYADFDATNWVTGNPAQIKWGCVDISTGIPCGGPFVYPGVTTEKETYRTTTETVGTRSYVVLDRSKYGSTTGGNQNAIVICFDTATNAKCAGWTDILIDSTKDISENGGVCNGSTTTVNGVQISVHDDCGFTPSLFVLNGLGLCVGNEDENSGGATQAAYCFDNTGATIPGISANLLAQTGSITPGAAMHGDYNVTLTMASGLPSQRLYMTQDMIQNCDHIGIPCGTPASTPATEDINRIYCYEILTGSTAYTPCTNFGTGTAGSYTGYKDFNSCTETRDGTVLGCVPGLNIQYGYIIDPVTQCMYGLAHSGSLWSFDPFTGATPCARSAANKVLNNPTSTNYCSGGSTIKADWQWYVKVLNAPAGSYSVKFYDPTLPGNTDPATAVGYTNGFVVDVNQTTPGTNLDLFPVGMGRKVNVAAYVVTDELITRPFNTLLKYELVYYDAIAGDAPAPEFCFNTQVDNTCNLGTVSNKADLQYGLSLWPAVGIPTGLTTVSSNVVSLGVTDALVCSGTDLTITKDDGKTTYLPNDTFNYTVVITNNGPNPVVDANFTDNQVAGQFVINSYTCTGSVGSDCNGSAAGTNAAGGAGNISQKFSLLASSSITYIVNVTVSSTATGNLTNTASETLPIGVTQTTVNLPDTASDTDTMAPNADLGITKTDGKLTYLPGENNSYTVVVTNYGPSNVVDATFTDNEVAGQFTILSYTCTGSATADCNGSTAGTNVAGGAGNISQKFSLNSGSTLTYTVNIKVSNTATGNLVNTASETLPVGVVQNPLLNNPDIAVDTDTYTPNADLGITKTDNKPNYFLLENFNYTVVITNNGPSNVVDANFTDSQVAGQFVINSYTCTGTSTADCNGSAAGTNVTGGAGNISQLFSLNAGSSLTYTVNVTVLATATGNLVNTASETLPVGMTQNPITNALDSATDTDILLPTYSLGNNVWNDKNGNGVKETGENGIDGVTIRLIDNATGLTANTSFGVAVANQTSTLGGYYRFDNLLAGDYVAEVVTSNFTGAGTLTTYLQSTVTETNPNLDVDLNNNSLYTATQSTTGMKTGIMTLGALAEPTTEVDGAGTGSTVDKNGILPNAQTNLTLDFGFYVPACIGDFVWLDTNHNGVQDAGEAGVAGATLSLKHADGTPVILAGPTTVANVTSDANGAYKFCGLPQGSYTVTITPPTGYALSNLDQGGNDATDSDVGNGVYTTAPINLVNGVDQLTWDMGLYQPSLGDYVWLDVNHNGQQDSGEPAEANINVNLYACGSSTVLRTMMTDANGKYLFTLVPTGCYDLKFDPPTGKILTDSNVSGVPDTLDSDADMTSHKITNIVMGAVDDITQDAGTYQPRIGDYVWYDEDGNGKQDPSEKGINGIKVELYQSGGTSPIQTITTYTNTLTGISGYYFFSVAPGDYFLKFERPIGKIVTYQDQGTDDAVDSDIDSNGKTKVFSVVGAIDQFTWDAGYVLPACLGDRVFVDTNGNGKEDLGTSGAKTYAELVALGKVVDSEVGIAGVIVTIVTPDGTKITAVTDENGSYKVCGLLPGNYTVQIDQNQPALQNYPDFSYGYSSTSDQSIPVKLNPGDNYTTADFGYLPYAQIGDQVYIDYDHNCLFDGVDKGVEGIKLNLKDKTGAIVANTVTDAMGIYHFKVPSGTYYTVEVDPAWKTSTQLGPDTPTCGTSKSSPTLTTHQNYVDLDFGFLPPVLVKTGASIVGFLVIGFSALILAVGGYVYFTYFKKRKVETTNSIK